MTIHALCSGVLCKAPEARTSKGGKGFTTATLKVKDGDAVDWVKLLAFGADQQAELARLGDGDALSVTGSLSAQLYAPSDREARVSLTLFVDAVLPLRAPPKAKAAKQETIPERAPPTRGTPYEDEIPF